MCSQVRWKLCWENELELADHVGLADFFRRIYGPTGLYNAKPFEGSRSWAGARPEVRAIGYDSGGVAAHMGLLRRFIKVGAVDLPVAELGLYGVRTDLERLGISHSIRAVLPILGELAVPFAFGTVRPALQKHIERLGRHGPMTVLSGVRGRSMLPEPRLDKPPTRIDDALVTVLPIGRSMADWCDDRPERAGAMMPFDCIDVLTLIANRKSLTCCAHQTRPLRARASPQQINRFLA